MAAGLYYIDSIVTAAVNKYGPGVTQTTVRLGGVSSSLINTTIELSGLAIGNPKGFSASNALTIGSISADADRDSLFTDTITINSIDVSDIGVMYELAGKTSNLTVLSENISHYMSSMNKNKTSQPKKKADDAAQKPPKKVIIKKLTIRNAVVNIASSVFLTDKTVSTSIRLPDITLENIGDGGAMTYSQVAAYILNLISMNTIEALGKTVYKDVLFISENALHMTKAVAGAAIDVTGDVLNAAKDITAGTVGIAADVAAGTVNTVTDAAAGTAKAVKDVAGETAGAVKNVGESVGNSIKGLFGG